MRRHKTHRKPRPAEEVVLTRFICASPQAHVIAEVLAGGTEGPRVRIHNWAVGELPTKDNRAAQVDHSGPGSVEQLAPHESALIACRICAADYDLNGLTIQRAVAAGESVVKLWPTGYTNRVLRDIEAHRERGV